MDKATKTLGFGHCFHLSSSGLSTTPQLTGRGNTKPSGASVRSPSLSPPVLAVDAVTKHSSSLDIHPQCHPASTSPSSPSSAPQSSPRAAQGRPSGQASRSSFHQEQAQVLVATRKSPGSTGGHVPRDSRDCPCSEQREQAGLEKRHAVNCFVPRNPGPGAKYFQSQASMCLG